jgi:hypothetical protein
MTLLGVSTKTPPYTLSFTGIPKDPNSRSADNCYLGYGVLSLLEHDIHYVSLGEKGSIIRLGLGKYQPLFVVLGIRP